MVGDKEAGPDSALLVVLSTVVAVGVLDGLSQGAIFGDAADLPPAYTHVSTCTLTLDPCRCRGLHRLMPERFTVHVGFSHEHICYGYITITVWLLKLFAVGC